MTLPSKTTTDSWIALARAYGAVLTRVEQALSDNDLPPLVWYDVLLELERAGKAGLRQNELEKALLLKQYNVSRLVDRIEAKGHLTRQPHPKDGRAKRLSITPSGEHLRRAMWKVYGSELQGAIGDRLTDADNAAIGNLLRKIRE